MTMKSHLFGAACAAALTLTLSLSAHADGVTAKHVLLISIDGLHEMDVANFIKANPESTMAKLAAHGTHFTNASSAKPSDSFPGLLALITGGTPKSTGVYYDNSYDRMLSPAGSDCKVKGTEAVLDEGVDKDPDAIDGGGGIDEAKLPRDGANGCKPVFPHSFLRTNTIFEVAKAAGMKTAWSDKHPAYDLVNGPSGKGVDDLFVPEINSKGEITSTAALTAAYDDTKVAAVINQINGKSSTGKDGAGVPAIFGMNFQAVSVGQKTVGYTDAKGTPQPALGEAIKHTDASLGKIMAALTAKDLDKETLMIVGAKHAQSPIDPAAKKITDEAFIPDAIEGVQKGLAAHVTMDSVALIWLSDAAKTGDAVKALEAIKEKGNIAEIYGAEKVMALFGDASKDSRIPNIVVIPKPGVIYAKPTAKKVGEHGGFGEDDSHVGLIVSMPSMAATTVVDPVTNMQVAPTILKALGLDPMSLQSVKAEGTKVLPGF